MASKRNNLKAGAILAASAGYVIGILTAPKSGRDTRKGIAKSASRAKTQGEKQLKSLHSDLADLLDQANKQKLKAGSRAASELKEASEKAKIAKDKAKLLLSALHDGDADDPNLKAVIKEVNKAKVDLVKFLKK